MRIIYGILAFLGLVMLLLLMVLGNGWIWITNPFRKIRKDISWNVFKDMDDRTELDEHERFYH